MYICAVCVFVCVCVCVCVVFANNLVHTSTYAETESEYDYAKFLHVRMYV